MHFAGRKKTVQSWVWGRCRWNPAACLMSWDALTRSLECLSIGKQLEVAGSGLDAGGRGWKHKWKVLFALIDDARNDFTRTSDASPENTQKTKTRIMRRCCLLRESIDTGCVNPLAARVRVRVYVCIGRTCVQPQSRVWRPLLACLVFLVFLVACAATARHGVVLPPQLAEKLILARSNQRSKCLHLPDNNNNNSNGAAYPPLDQQLPSLKSQQTPRSLKVASSSPLAEPKHFQANLCSFPTNVDNSQHFHFIMAQRTHQVAKGYAALLSWTSARTATRACFARGTFQNIIMQILLFLYDKPQNSNARQSPEI